MTTDNKRSSIMSIASLVHASGGSSTVGRRLLHLGGAEFQIPAIECARQLGCFVITADNRPENPGHRMADVCANVSTTDRDAVLSLARQHRVDAIMTYGSDVAAPTVCYVAEKLGLPGNPLSAAEVLQRKDLFRAFQEAQGLPHPEFQVVANPEEAQAAYLALGGRVVVKAADSSGSKGLSVIQDGCDAALAFERAQGFSRCGVVVLERYLQPDMLELDGDILVKDGHLAFRHYGHNYFTIRNESFTPCGEMFPGFFGDDIAEQLDQQLQAIISVLDISIGCLNFDAIVARGRVHLLEIGLRNGGNYVPHLIHLSTGYDLTRAAVLSALGADVPCGRRLVPDALPVASYILNSEVEGRFEGFDLSPEIEKFVVGSRLFCEIDSHVMPFTRGDRALGIVFFRFPDKPTMQRIMAEIGRHVSVRVLPANVPVTPEGVGGEVRYDYVRYSQLVSPYLRSRLADAEQNGDKIVQRVIGRQFLETEAEQHVRREEGRKHYEADVGIEFEGVRLRGVERLYEKVVVVEPLLQCAAHCRHCLRRYYEPFHLTREDLSRIARFIGRAPTNAALREVLVTGGDPFLIPDRLNYFLSEVAQHATQIRIARIATRLPVQQPDWVSEEILSVLRGRYPFQIEVATQINNAVELSQETVAAYERILRAVRVVYNQTVLLAGVNDTLDELVALCCALREIGIENHYIFHCVPIVGMASLRVPLDRMIQLVNQLSACGRVSGRAKPKLCVMTDIGKIALYEGSIVKRDRHRYLLQSAYSKEDRLKWNPNWILPPNSEVDEQGFLRIWYVDSSGCLQ
jgi:lysine 2,3-aminomutase